MKEARRRLPLSLQGAPELTGCGSQVALRFEAIRKNKAGNFERYAVELELCRHNIRVLCEQVAALQARDEERIQRELDRLNTEIAAVVARAKRPQQ